MTFRVVLSPADYAALVKWVRQRDRHRCRHCKSGNALHVHHIVFRSRGGGDVSANLITLCNTCHDRVHVLGTLVILASSGDPDDPIDANKGVKFLVVRK